MSFDQLANSGLNEGQIFEIKKNYDSLIFLGMDQRQFIFNWINIGMNNQLNHRLLICSWDLSSFKVYSGISPHLDYDSDLIVIVYRTQLSNMDFKWFIKSISLPDKLRILVELDHTSFIQLMIDLHKKILSNLNDRLDKRLEEGRYS